MRIVSFGAGGFIGSHLTARLLAAGHRVAALDTHTDKLSELLPDGNLTFLRQDIRDARVDLDALVAGADLVVDLIAHANPGTYIKHPLDVFRLNFADNLRIAEACVRFEKRLIQFSSCEVYGKTPAAVLPAGELRDPESPRHAVFSEDTSSFILGPVGKHRWIYACGKQLLERVLHAYGLEGRLNYTIVRPFNFVGPKIDYLPSRDDGTPRVFSFFMEALLTGTPLKLVDGGSHRRCYTYIDDAVDCLARIVENPGGVCDRQIFNVGAPQNETSIRELAELMREIYAERFGAPGEPRPAIIDVPAAEFYGEGYEDSDRRIPDITKARTLLGWEPRWGLRDLLGETMAYYVAEERRPRGADPCGGRAPDPR